MSTPKENSRTLEEIHELLEVLTVTVLHLSCVTVNQHAASTYALQSIKYLIQGIGIGAQYQVDPSCIKDDVSTIANQMCDCLDKAEDAESERRRADQCVDTAKGLLRAWIEDKVDSALRCSVKVISLISRDGNESQEDEGENAR